MTLSNVAGKAGNRSQSTHNMCIHTTHAVSSEMTMVSGQTGNRPWQGWTGCGLVD